MPTFSRRSKAPRTAKSARRPGSESKKVLRALESIETRIEKLAKHVQTIEKRARRIEEEHMNTNDLREALEARVTELTKEYDDLKEQIVAGDPASENEDAPVKPRQAPLASQESFTSSRNSSRVGSVYSDVAFPADRPVDDTQASLTSQKSFSSSCVSGDLESGYSHVAPSADVTQASLTDLSSLTVEGSRSSPSSSRTSFAYSDDESSFAADVAGCSRLNRPLERKKSFGKLREENRSEPKKDETGRKKRQMAAQLRPRIHKYRCGPDAEKILSVMLKWNEEVLLMLLDDELILKERIQFICNLLGLP
ncbi:hypothetical protein L596_010153 [Steinernema carpocapsae]|uniref:Uncharacterized protein n=1 Tax=Steinernema carpocapsae TaxID=34508 RepID=A0A4U5PI90_STECR|nr:hypothetical protein L596_010153 [Steinernema carpocapsae]